jgi:hypothetical protein
MRGRSTGEPRGENSRNVAAFAFGDPGGAPVVARRFGTAVAAAAAAVAGGGGSGATSAFSFRTRTFCALPVALLAAPLDIVAKIKTAFFFSFFFFVSPILCGRVSCCHKSISHSSLYVSFY